MYITGDPEGIPYSVFTEKLPHSLEKTPDALTEFSLDAFTAPVDYITVYAKDDIRVTFRNGQEIKA